MQQDRALLTIEPDIPTSRTEGRSKSKYWNAIVGVFSMWETGTLIQNQLRFPLEPTMPVWLIAFEDRDILSTHFC